MEKLEKDMSEIKNVVKQLLIENQDHQSDVNFKKLEYILEILDLTPEEFSYISEETPAYG